MHKPTHEEAMRQYAALQTCLLILPASHLCAKLSSPKTQVFGAGILLLCW